MTSTEAIPKTVPDGTMTACGYIRHRQHPAGFDMPVRLAKPTADARASLNGYLQPLRDSKGRIVWALPGGGSYVEPEESKCQPQ